MDAEGAIVGAGDWAAPPTSSLVQVAALAHPDLLVEIEAVAAVTAEAG